MLQALYLLIISNHGYVGVFLYVRLFFTITEPLEKICAASGSTCVVTIASYLLMRLWKNYECRPGKKHISGIDALFWRSLLTMDITITTHMHLHWHLLCMFPLPSFSFQDTPDLLTPSGGQIA